MQFRAEARRNKLSGLWAAGLMGKPDDEAAAYAMEVVNADFEEAGTRTWCARSLAIWPARPRRTRCGQMRNCSTVAKSQLMSEL